MNSGIDQVEMESTGLVQSNEHSVSFGFVAEHSGIPEKTLLFSVWELLFFDVF